MKNFARPEDLSPLGQQAHEIILPAIEEADLVRSGVRVFYSPAEWAARGETYGLRSELIIVTEDSSISPLLGDVGYSLTFEKPAEALAENLSEVGLYVEICTGWYCAVYRINGGEA